MANLVIEMPDDLVGRLQRIAASEHKTIQELTTEWLHSLAELSMAKHREGSPSAVLQALLDPPHPSALDVAKLEEAIAAGQSPVRARNLFFD